MKVKHIKHFQVWLKVILELDKRLTVSDFNRLVKLYKNSFLSIVAIFSFYAVGGWADTLWATCTDGKKVSTCRIIPKGIIINGKLVDAHIIRVTEFNDDIKVLYRER